MNMPLGFEGVWVAICKIVPRKTDTRQHRSEVGSTAWPAFRARAAAWPQPTPPRISTGCPQRVFWVLKTLFGGVLPFTPHALVRTTLSDVFPALK